LFAVRLGVDTGGTFTDFVANLDGQLQVYKRFSTPHDPSQAILSGLSALAERYPALRQPDHLAHGSTVATNTILERSGAKLAFITTGGFRDMLYLGRQNRPVLYALQPHIVPPLVALDLCFEVPERLDQTGAVIMPLDEQALEAVIDQIAARQVEAIAVCLLHSYLNSAHERAVRERLLARGLWSDSQIALSCEVLPEFREYERASTVTLEAYVRPRVRRYLSRLGENLSASCSLRIMKSDGGIVSAARAGQRAIQTALSGPAAGVIGAFYIASLAGFDQIITLDMGGTSTDVALCPRRVVRYPEREIDGLPLRTPTLDIETIGAGGGSIVRLDAGGALRVGPESAGADPGSIIYGRGGTQITISDANAVLGRLDADHFLGGAMRLDLAPALAEMEALGAAMRLDAAATAAGVIQIANVKIEQAIRRVSIARGFDPRDFTLVSFGGAGPLHACEVAARLAIPRVLVPRYPGAMCALGLLTADVVLDYSQAILGLPLDAAAIRARLDDMITQARRDLAQENIPGEAMEFFGLVDVRYQGQAYELSIPFAADLSVAFDAAHNRHYGYALPGRPIEMVNLRLQAVGRIEKPPFVMHAERQHAAVPIGQKSMPGNPAFDRVALYERENLQPGARFAGPALVFQMDSTVYVAPGWSVRVDGYRNLLLLNEHNAQVV
jgi:N-methylhydantoinase A